VTWDETDVWVLRAVALGAVDLCALVGNADYLGHAILLPEEVERTVGRLAASGLLTVTDGPGFALTLTGRAVTTPRGVAQVAQRLGRVPSREGTFGLDRTEFRKAIDRYLRRE
jgi:hypothetical protein